MRFVSWFTIVPLVRLNLHMARMHPVALDVLLGDKLAGFRPDRTKRGISLNSLSCLQNACFDPRLFPVHVLADEFVVKQIKHVRRNLFVEFFAFLGIVILQ